MVDLDEIKQRLANATPGPWRVQIAACDHEDAEQHAAVKGGGYLVVACVDEENADLIAHAPTDLAALVAEVEMLRDLLGDKS